MKDSRYASLPTKGDLTLAYACSLVIALLMTVTAAAGLLFRDTIYPTDELILAFAPVDLFHLLVGMPVLVGATWLARSGRLVGLLCLPGALLYVLYSYILNLIGVPFGVLFLPYLLLVTLSAYTSIGIVANIDRKVVRERLVGIVPASTAGGVLAGLASLFMVLAVIGIITTLLSQRPVGPFDRMLWIADLSSVGPAGLIGGILLLKRRALGYTGGAGLLLTFGMLFIGLVPVLVFQTLYTGSPLDVVGTVTMLALGLICLMLLARFARGVAKSSTSSAQDTLS
jgi:hypothetical protein